ncbi:MAG TPA: hypothetical protein VFZ77_16540 [Acidimicrobiales bacterium]
MADWTRDLATAYATCRGAHPEDRALVVCDLDGTVLERQGSGPPRASRGVLDALRWFHAQPLTSVAVVVDRPAAQRAATLAELEEIGRPYRLAWDPDLVRLRPDGAAADPAAHRVDALQHWRQAGHRVVAVVDGDRTVLERLGRSGAAGDTLLLPTADMRAGRRAAAAGAGGHVELVWHEVNDRVRMSQFLASPMRWAEIDVRLDPDGALALRHDDFAPGDGDDGAPDPHEVLARMRAAGKGVNLDVKDPDALGTAVAAVAGAGIDDGDLWLNGRIDKLGEKAMRAVARDHPDARLQCPVEFLGPLAGTMPHLARAVINELHEWGVDRFSLAWTNTHRDLLIDRLDAWGAEVNLYAVTDLRTFLTAVMRLPHSLTADLTIPEWHYFGRGSGNDGDFHRDSRAAATSPGVDMP